MREPKGLAFSLNLLFLALLVCSCSSSNARPENWIAPYTRVTLLNGEYDLLQTENGQPLAIMFWASWCPGSRSSIDDYAELAEKFRTLKFVAVSLDSSEREQAMLQFIRENNLQGLTHAFSGNEHQDEAAMAYHVEEIPYFFLINTRSQVVYEGGSVGDLEDAISELS